MRAPRKQGTPSNAMANCAPGAIFGILRDIVASIKIAMTGIIGLSPNHSQADINGQRTLRTC
jgi:hypothetical protein